MNVRQENAVSMPILLLTSYEQRKEKVEIDIIKTRDSLFMNHLYFPIPIDKGRQNRKKASTSMPAVISSEKY